MESWVWEILAFVDLFALFAIGAGVSVIGAIKQWRTNSSTEGILLIIVGASIMSLSALMAPVVTRIFRP
jgi:hypothetical protein